MTEKGKTVGVSLFKKWIIIIGIFIVLQLIFITIDGTFLEPKLNRLGNFATKIVQMKFFTKWFTLYHNPFFKLITTVAVLQIIFTAIKDIIVGFVPRK